MATQVELMVDGYAYSSMATLESVMIVKSEADRARFMGVEIHDGIEYCRYRIDGKNYWQFKSIAQIGSFRLFDDSDVQPSSSWDGYIDTCDDDYIIRPLQWQERGLSQTASGYGSKLTTTRCLWFNGRLHRIYCACYSNNGTAYIVSRGRRIIVR